MAYVNLIMYNRTLPDYDYDSKDKDSGRKGRKSNGKNLLELDNAEWDNYLK